MKKHRMSLLAMAVLVIAGTRAPAELAMNLTINSGEEKIVYGQPVMAQIDIVNRGDAPEEIHKMHMGLVGQYPRIRWERPDGRTREFETDFTATPASGKFLLGPGETYRRIFDITVSPIDERDADKWTTADIWSFNQLGAYTIQASYAVWDSQGRALPPQLQSEPVRIEIVEPRGGWKAQVDEYRTMDTAVPVFTSNYDPEASEEAIEALEQLANDPALAPLHTMARYYLALALAGRAEDLVRVEGKQDETLALQRRALDLLMEIVKEDAGAFPNLQMVLFRAGELARTRGQGTCRGRNRGAKPVLYAERDAFGTEPVGGTIAAVNYRGHSVIA